MTRPRDIPAGGGSWADDPRLTRMHFVVNCKAGNAEENRIVEALHRHRKDTGREWSYDLRRSSGQKRSDMVRRALDEGKTAIVAVGGDGTVSKVAAELVGTNALLGIVPTGTANLLARDLEIPLDLDEAFDLLKRAPGVRRLDAMQTGERFCFSHISLGTYSLIARQESTAIKKRFGKLAYMWNLLRATRRHDRWQFRVTLDGESHTESASLILAANAGATGLGRVSWGDHIRPDDGQIDLCLIRAEGLVPYARLLWQSFWGKAVDSTQVDYLKFDQSCEIAPGTPLPIRGDGDVIGEGNVRIKVVPGAVEIISPSPID